MRSPGAPPNAILFKGQPGSLQIMRNIALALLGSLAILAGLVVAGLMWWEWPNLSVEDRADRVVVHTELMKDYPSDVGQFQIAEATTGRVLWDGRPEGRMVQMHRLALKVGANDSTPAVFRGRFRDTGANAFRLENGVRYVIKVCTPTLVPLCESKTFEFHKWQPALGQEPPVDTTPPISNLAA